MNLINEFLIKNAVKRVCNLYSINPDISNISLYIKFFLIPYKVIPLEFN